MSMVLSISADIQSELSANPEARLYALADAAQDSSLPEALRAVGPVACLFTEALGSPTAKVSPHLVELGTWAQAQPAVRWAALNAHRSPCLNLMVSGVGFSPLLTHCRRQLEIQLPDGDDMFLAYWDPDILAALLGQPVDFVRHVVGPVLTPGQSASLCGPFSAWWAWDRHGQPHRLKRTCGLERQFSDEISAAHVPMVLTQEQVDMLVEASVPDHLLHYIRLNQAHLLLDMPQREHWAFVCEALQQARSWGLNGMADLVNYTCAALIYKERFSTEPAIQASLKQVKIGAMCLDEAMETWP